MSSKTQVFFGQVAREGYMRGINIVADAVVPTLGPKGRCVLLSPGASRPKITKDGVSVAKSICLSDPLEEAGAQLIRNVAAQACSNAGDGTTTATLLARALIVEGHRLIAAGYDPISLKQGIDNSLASVVEYLRARSRECTSLESLQHVATISANGDTAIGNMIGEAVFRSGENGIINVRDGTALKDTIEYVEGMIVDSGAVSNDYMPHNGRPWQGESALVLISGSDLDTTEQLRSIIAVLDNFDERPVVMIAPSFGEEFEYSVRRYNGPSPRVMLVKTPGFGSTKVASERDLAAYTTATVVGEAAGVPLNELKSQHIGYALLATVTRRNMTIQQDTSDATVKSIVTKLLEDIQALIDSAEDDRSRRNARDRYARLTGTVCNIVVGGTSEFDVKERRDRIDDAIGATQAAQTNGVLPGGGVALAMAAKAVICNGLATDAQTIGHQLLMKVLRQPMSQLALNAGQHPDVIAYRIEAASEKFEVPGWDASTDTIVDMFEAGIIDPTQVTVGSLTSAVSVGSLLLITDSVVVSDIA